VLSQPFADGQRSRQRGSPAELVGRQLQAQLDQGERVARRRGDQLVAHSRVEPRAGGPGEQIARLGVGERLEPQLTEAVVRLRLRALVGSEDDPDRAAGQPPRDVAEDLGRASVQLRGVVDEAQERLHAANGLEGGQDGETEGEEIPGVSVAIVERGQRITMSCG
jgi:hypothetical protein